MGSMDADGYLVRTSWAGKEGETPVHGACHKQDVSQLQSLLAEGHDPWATSDTGATPVTVLYRYWCRNRDFGVPGLSDQEVRERQDRIVQCVDAIFVNPSTARLRTLGRDRRDLVLRTFAHVFRRVHAEDALDARMRLYLTALGLADQARERASF